MTKETTRDLNLERYKRTIKIIANIDQEFETVETKAEECERCGKLCRNDQKYPTSTQILTSFGYFCSWGCLETYAAEKQKTILSFFLNDFIEE